jgi:hypothetical protein
MGYAKENLTYIAMHVGTFPFWEWMRAVEGGQWFPMHAGWPREKTTDSRVGRMIIGDVCRVSDLCAHIIIS